MNESLKRYWHQIPFLDSFLLGQKMLHEQPTGWRNHLWEWFCLPRVMDIAFWKKNLKIGAKIFVCQTCTICMYVKNWPFNHHMEIHQYGIDSWLGQCLWMVLLNYMQPIVQCVWKYQQTQFLWAAFISEWWNGVVLGTDWKSDPLGHIYSSYSCQWRADQ